MIKSEKFLYSILLSVVFNRFAHADEFSVCQSEITTEKFFDFYQAYKQAKESTSLIGDSFNVYGLCDKSWDMFFFSGSTICADERFDHINEVFCLPVSCTYDETLLTEVLPMFINDLFLDNVKQLDDGTYTVDPQGECPCTGSEYEFSGLTRRNGPILDKESSGSSKQWYKRSLLLPGLLVIALIIT